MWAGGVMQGLMWRAVDGEGNLTYNFVETVQAMHPYYLVRFLGGVLYFTGMLIMVYNLVRTTRGARTVEMPIPGLAH